MSRRLPAAVDLRGADDAAALVGEFSGREAIVAWVDRRSKALLVFVLVVGGQGCTYDYARFKEEAAGSSAGTATTSSWFAVADAGDPSGPNSTPATSGGASHRENTSPQLGGDGAMTTESANTDGSTGGHDLTGTRDTSHFAGGSTAHVPTSAGTTSAQTKSFGGSGGATPVTTASYGDSGGTTPAAHSYGGSSGGMSGSITGGAGGSAAGGTLSTPAGGQSSTLGSGGIAGASASCVPPLVDCGGTCVNVTGDPMHCGACGRSCFQASASWAICVDQRCSCNSGGSLCAVGQICEKKSVCVDSPK